MDISWYVKSGTNNVNMSQSCDILAALCQTYICPGINSCTEPAVTDITFLKGILNLKTRSLLGGNMTIIVK